MAARRQEIILQMKTGEVQNILATVVNEVYAVHRSINPRSKFWAISHIPTGLLITLTDSATEAKSLAETFPIQEKPNEDYIAALAQLVERFSCKE